MIDPAKMPLNRLANTIIDGLAQSPTMLILGRAVQGFGGALISPAALSIITTTFEEGPPRNKAPHRCE